MEDAEEQTYRGFRCADLSGHLGDAATVAGLRVVYAENSDEVGDGRAERQTTPIPNFDILLATLGVDESQKGRAFALLRERRPLAAMLVGADLHNDARLELALMGYEASISSGVVTAWQTPAHPKVHAKLYDLDDALVRGLYGPSCPHGV